MPSHTPDHLDPSPSFGFLSKGPFCALTNEKKIIADDMMLDVLEGWIEKSKQVCYSFYFIED